MENIDWYNSLNRPFLNPPSEIFMPVWIILYIMISASLMLFLRGNFHKEKILPLTYFSLQMILNFSWQGVFFGMKNIQGAFIIAVLMWIFIIFTIITFFKHSKLSAILLIPYLLWVTFACYLNFEYVRLN